MKDVITGVVMTTFISSVESNKNSWFVNLVTVYPGQELDYSYISHFYCGKE